MHKNRQVSPNGEATLDQLRKIKQQLAYYQQLSLQLNHQVKSLTQSQSLERKKQIHDMTYSETIVMELQEKLVDRDLVIEQMNNKNMLLREQLSSSQKQMERLRRQVGELQSENTALTQELHKAEMASKQTILIQRNGQATEIQKLNLKIAQLSQNACESRLRAKYDKAKRYISQMKSDWHRERQEATMAISSLHSQIDSIKCQKQRYLNQLDKNHQINRQLAEEVKNLTEIIRQTTASLQQSETLNKQLRAENAKLKDKLRDVQLSHQKMLKFNEETQEELGQQLTRVAQAMRNLIQQKQLLQRKNYRLMKEMRMRSDDSQD